MVAKLLFYIFIGSGLFIPLGLAAWTFVLKPRLGPVLERRRLWKKASLRMRVLTDYERSQACIVCDKSTDPEKDAFDPRTKSWLHAPCYRQLIGTDPLSKERKPS